MSTPVERSIISYLMHPEIRDITIGYFADYMFQTPYLAAMCNVLGREEYRGQVPNVNSFVLNLHQTQDLDEEGLEFAAALAIEFTQSRDRAPTKTEIESAISQIESFIRDRMIDYGMEKIATAGSSSSQAHAGREVLSQALNFAISTDLFYDFSDPQMILEARNADFPAGGVVIKSHFSLVNKSSSIKGYKYGDLVAVVAKPGVGKSTGMVDEGAYAIQQGFRVCHLFLGDMSEYDGFVKYMSYWTGASSDELINEGHDAHWSPEVADNFSRLRVKALPADQYDIYQIIAKLNQIRRSFKFDMVIIDYDANIKSQNSDNMYGEGGNIYANLKSYGKGKCVVMIGSQAKTVYWDLEILPMDAPAESSKKGHHVDIMLTIGRNKVCPHLGTINIAKMRRGQAERQMRLHFDYAKCRMREIGPLKYDEMLIAHKTKSAQSEAAGIYDEPSDE